MASWRWAYGDALSPEFLDGVTVDARERDWSRWLMPSPRSGALVAGEGGAIVGFCSFGPSRDDDGAYGTAEIVTIYLRPESAGRGIGRALFDRANERLRSFGFRRATLWVMAANERSRRFYEAAGWTWDGTTSAHRFDCANVPIVRYAVDL